MIMSARTNLLTARASSRPLALCLNWQSLHEFSLNTDINVCCSGLTCVRALSAPGWWQNKFYRCYCNVLGSQNAHPLTETYISRTLFVLRVIYNKPYYTWVVRFKLNRSPSACRTVCGEPCGSIFFPWTVPPLIYTYVCVCMYIYIFLYFIILFFLSFFLSIPLINTLFLN